MKMNSNATRAGMSKKPLMLYQKPVLGSENWNIVATMTMSSMDARQEWWCMKDKPETLAYLQAVCYNVHRMHAGGKHGEGSIKGRHKAEPPHPARPQRDGDQPGPHNQQHLCRQTFVNHGQYVQTLRSCPLFMSTPSSGVCPSSSGLILYCRTGLCTTCAPST